eukprot:scaffold224452_cov30-Prasinocladus_malaysianus.AAC.2
MTKRDRGQLRHRTKQSPADRKDSADQGDAQQPAFFRRQEAGLGDILVVLVCLCLPLLDKAASELLAPQFGSVFGREGEWLWRLAGLLGAGAGWVFCGPASTTPPSEGSRHGWSAVLWSASAYTLLMIPLSK